MPETGGRSVQRPSSKGSRTRGSKVQGLLATDESEAVVSVPEAVRVAVVAAEPQLAAVVPDVEDEADAVPNGDGLHRHQHPFASRLVGILETQSGADFRRAELEAELDRLGADVRVAGTVLEAEVADRKHDEVDFRLLLRAGDTAEDVVAPVADLLLGLLDGRAVVVGALVEPELHRLPDGHLERLGRRNEQFAAQEAQSSLLAAELLHDGVQLPCGQILRCEVHKSSLG